MGWKPTGATELIEKQLQNLKSIREHNGNNNRMWAMR